MITNNIYHKIKNILNIKRTLKQAIKQTNKDLIFFIELLDN
ncbi:ankyrin repeat protein, putative [Brachyspira pilosicoli 95/1000]|uniref:Ankyrin repeat protein, putative n=1 Tax=Brachyspira pilosicoli (strain ATCC BAA-1826 / 95/1000) TaxID=759914 RepID=D8I9S9_BRAP9|nr:ankyrin repeat protein, putative [Brachyspira pilosicoli 95/1000]